jgi:hypothetical protein
VAKQLGKEEAGEEDRGKAGGVDTSEWVESETAVVSLDAIKIDHAVEHGQIRCLVPVLEEAKYSAFLVNPPPTTS